MPHRIQMSYAAKVVTVGVMLKAIVMGTLVSLLAVSAFGKSLILVVVSATATGIFGILIVLIQTHSEARIHERLNAVEDQINTKSEEIQTKQDEAATKAAEQVVEAIQTKEQEG